jgi:hypothetical protein
MWWCDRCDRPIQSASDGWVEWYRHEDETVVGEGPLLVHKDKRCQADENELYKRRFFVGDTELAGFLGSDGLVHLASLGSSYRLEDERLRVLICRLHVPGFELARHHYDEAVAAEVFEPNLPKPFMWAEQITAVTAWVNARHP